MTTQQFGPYLLGDLLGSGGMGEVYRAEDTRRDRWVALKLLPDLFANDPDYQARFRRESLVAARLRDPHVIPIHDYGELDGRLFIDMRLVDGEDLGSLLAREGILPPARAVDLVGQVAEALDAAHAQDLVHRDVKPSNVLVTRNDFVYVVDFGVARTVGLTSTSLTVTGATVGTLEYMAPERFTNQPIDGRSDIYSLSCLLAECLTGRRPFRGEDLPSLMYAHLYAEPSAPSSVVPSIPAALDEVVLRGMSKRPEDRFASAGELAAAARKALRDVAPPLATVTGAVAAASGAPPDESVAGSLPPRSGAAVTGMGPVQPESSSQSVDARFADGGPIPSGERRAGAGTNGPGSGALGGAPNADSSAAPTVVPRPSAAGPVDDPAVRRSRPGLHMALIAAVVAAVVLAVTVVVLRWPGGSDGAAVGTATGRAGTGATSSVAASPVADGGGTSSAPVQPATSLATPTAGALVTVPSSPHYMAIAPNGRFAYIAHPTPGQISVFDTTLDAVTATIPIPEGPPQFLTFAPDGLHAYVTITNTARTQNAVDFLDTQTNRVVRTVQVGKGPFAPAASPDGKRLYVPLHDENHLDVIDTGTGAILAQIAVPANPHWVAVSRDGTIGYTANHDSNVVTALDLRNNTVITTIPVGKAPHSITFSPDGSRVSVVDFVGDDVTVIDTATNTVVGSVPNVGNNPQDISYAPDGKHFYTANVDDATISVVDAATNAVTARIPTGKSPTSIAVLPNGRQAFVTNFDDGTVRILDLVGT